MTSTTTKAIGQALLGFFFLVIAYWLGVIGTDAYTQWTYGPEGYGLYEIRHTRPIAGIIFGIMGVLTLIFGPIGVFMEKGEENKKKKLVDKYKK